MSGNSIVQEDVVRTIMPGDAGSPVGVLFEEHAAVYFLHREDPQFGEWLSRLQESKLKRVRVRFKYTEDGQRLTLVDLVK